MKRILLSLTIILAAVALKAQENTAEQNPDYKISMDKYIAIQTSLQATNNTTLQNTYKAYDWSTARTERRTERRNYRRERRLYDDYSIFGNYGYYGNYGNGNYGRYNNYNGYNNNYNGYSNWQQYNNYRPRYRYHFFFNFLPCFF